MKNLKVFIYTLLAFLLVLILSEYWSQQRLILPSKVIDRVCKFVFFVGYGRSGHSFIGSILDAHPHIIVPHEYYLFSNLPKPWPFQSLKANLFNILYSKSVSDASHVRRNAGKGYSLEIDGLWQGRYKDYIEIIGDKSAGSTTRLYLENKKNFQNDYERLKTSLGIPIRVFHVVRNPFDMIATRAVIKNEGRKTLRNSKKLASKGESHVPLKFNSSKHLDEEIFYLFSSIAATQELIEDVLGRENVLDVHNCDLVDDPRGTISKIFEFLEVHTTEHYLDVCAEKVFKSVSRSRNIVVWTPEQIRTVEKRMQEYKAFSRYSFTSAY